LIPKENNAKNNLQGEKTSEASHNFPNFMKKDSTQSDAVPNSKSGIESNNNSSWYSLMNESDRVLQEAQLVTADSKQLVKNTHSLLEKVTQFLNWIARIPQHLKMTFPHSKNNKPATQLSSNPGTPIKKKI
jgi:hypothetical protein